MKKLIHPSSLWSQLQLATVNSTKTAFCMFSLGLEAFDKYRLSGPTVNLPVGSGVKARLLVKVCTERHLTPGRINR